MTEFVVHEDNLSDPAVIELLEHHLADLARHSPIESMHAMPVERLTGPDVTFWTVWSGDRVAGCGGLKEIDPGHGELKSMRAADAFRGKGVGDLILTTLLDESRHRAYERVSIETGSTEPFAPARALYARHGFVPCEPFAGYAADPWSVFMTLRLA